MHQRKTEIEVPLANFSISNNTNNHFAGALKPKKCKSARRREKDRARMTAYNMKKALELSLKSGDDVITNQQTMDICTPKAVPKPTALPSAPKAEAMPTALSLTPKADSGKFSPKRPICFTNTNKGVRRLQKPKWWKTARQVKRSRARTAAYNRKKALQLSLKHGDVITNQPAMDTSTPNVGTKLTALPITTLNIDTPTPHVMVESTQNATDTATPETTDTLVHGILGTHTLEPMDTHVQPIMNIQMLSSKETSMQVAVDIHTLKSMEMLIPKATCMPAVKASDASSRDALDILSPETMTTPSSKAVQTRVTAQRAPAKQHNLHKQ